MLFPSSYLSPWIYSQIICDIQNDVTKMKTDFCFHRCFKPSRLNDIYKIIQVSPYHLTKFVEISLSSIFTACSRPWFMLSTQSQKIYKYLLKEQKNSSLDNNASSIAMKHKEFNQLQLCNCTVNWAENWHMFKTLPTLNILQCIAALKLIALWTEV